MFLKEKYLASGEFDKLKARLVAGGNQQDKDMYDCDTRACHPTTHTTNRATGLSDSAIDTFGPEATGSNLPQSGESPHDDL
jgi:hypothetical protein